MTMISPEYTARIQKNFNDKVLDSKILNKVYKSAIENPAKFAGRMALWSALTKDVVNCYYYTTQSLHNKKIPEDKRGFVASLDLMNGILNVSLQFTVGIWLSKKMPVLFESMIGKKLKAVDTRKIADKLLKIVNKTNPNENMSFEQIEGFLRKGLLGEKGSVSKWLNIGFNAAVTLIATQVVTKRMVVPFLSTPLAGWFKEKFLDKKDKAPENRQGGLPAQTFTPLVYAKNDKAVFSKVVTK